MGRSPIAVDLGGRLVLLANRLSLSYWAIRAGSRLVAALPPRVSHAIAIALADLVFGLWGGIRARTTENMRWVTTGDPSPGRAARLARASFRNYFRYLVEFLGFAAMDRATIERAVQVQGVDHLHAAMAAGRGAIAIGFHIGNIDLGAAILAQVGYPVNVIVDRFEPARLDDLIQRQRREKGLAIIRLEDAPRAALRALRRKEILAILIDKPTPEDGVVVQFFGGQIAIPGGAAVLALRTGAPIVPCCVVRRADGGFRAEVAAPVDPAALATGDSHRDVQRITQRLVEILEAWVRRYPEQWYPFRRMWLAPAAGR